MLAGHINKLYGQAKQEVCETPYCTNASPPASSYPGSHDGDQPGMSPDSLAQKEHIPDMKVAPVIFQLFVRLKVHQRQ